MGLSPVSLPDLHGCGARLKSLVDPGRTDTNVLPAGTQARVPQKAGTNKPAQRGFMRLCPCGGLPQGQPGVCVNPNRCE